MWTKAIFHFHRSHGSIYSTFLFCLLLLPRSRNDNSYSARSIFSKLDFFGAYIYVFFSQQSQREYMAVQGNTTGNIECQKAKKLKFYVDICYTYTMEIICQGQILYFA